MKKLLSPEQKGDLKKVRKAFKLFEESKYTWFYARLFPIDGYRDDTIEKLVAQYEKKGFEFEKEAWPSMHYPKRDFLLPGKDYYLHRNDKVWYLSVKKTREFGKWAWQLEEMREKEAEEERMRKVGEEEREKWRTINFIKRG